MNRKIVFGAALAMALAPAAVAQSDSARGGAQGASTASLSLAAAHAGKVHGHAQNPLGQPIVEAIVFATKDGTPEDSSPRFTTDATGNYSGAVPEGEYIFVLQSKEQKGTKKEIDDSGGPVKVPEKDDITVDFDGTREAYMKKLTPEERKAVEEYKAKAAAVTAANNQALKLNEVLKAERADRANKQYDQAVTLATQITAGKPAEPIGWLELGMDQSLQGKYADAVPNLQKSIELSTASPKPNPEVLRVANTYLGDDLIYTGKAADSLAAYDAAVKFDPTKAADVYAGGATIAYNKQQYDVTLQLAEKAIAADPKAPMPYFLKGQALVVKTTMDKSGKPVVPPGCIEAYKQYLALAPNGAHAADVQAILQGLGSSVQTSVKSKRS